MCWDKSPTSQLPINLKTYRILKTFEFVQMLSKPTISKLGQAGKDMRKLMKIFTCFRNNVPRRVKVTRVKTNDLFLVKISTGLNKSRLCCAPSEQVVNNDQCCYSIVILSSCKACFIRRTIVEFNSDKFQIERIKCDGSGRIKFVQDVLSVMVRRTQRL